MKKKVCGIDVGKDNFAYSMSREMKPRGLSNDRAGIAKLLKKLVAEDIDLVVIEATGGYEQLVVSCLWEAKIKVAVVNPRQSRAFAKSVGVIAKTDPIDARLLAYMGESIELRCTVQPLAEIQGIRALLMRRAQLIQMLSMERCHLQAPLMPSSEKNALRAHILFLKSDIKKIDIQIDAIIKTMPDLSVAYKLLSSVKGVGKVVAYQLIANLPELGRLNRKKIAALVGLAPYNCDSGTFQGQRHIKGGRAQVRSALYMATLTAVRCNDKIKAYFVSLKKRGKHSMIALVAAMRKLLLILNATMRNQIKKNLTPHHLVA